MNRDDVIDVLTAVSAGTGREIGEVDVQLWQVVIDGVPKDFALSAVFAHFRDCPGKWLEPGLIVERWRDHRRDVIAREDEAERKAREDAWDAELMARNRERLAELINPVADDKAVPPPTYTRPSQRTDGKPNPLAIRCPWCHAPAHRPCRIPNIHGEKSVTLREPHPSRVEAVQR